MKRHSRLTKINDQTLPKKQTSSTPHSNDNTNHITTKQFHDESLLDDEGNDISDEGETPEYKARTSHLNFLPGERNLLLATIEDFIVNVYSTYPPSTKHSTRKLNWVIIAKQYNLRRKKGEGMTYVTTKDTSSDLIAKDGSCIETIDITVRERSPNSLRRLFKRLLHKNIKGRVVDNEADLNNSFARARKIHEWETSHPDHSPAITIGFSDNRHIFNTSGQANAENATVVTNGNTYSRRIFTGREANLLSRNISDLTTTDVGSFPISRNNNGDESNHHTTTAPNHNINNNHTNIQSLNHRRQSDLVTTTAAHPSDDADAEYEDLDDEVQSRHSIRTTRSQAELGYSQLLNDVVYGPIDMQSNPGGVISGAGHANLDGIFTPHSAFHGGHGTKDWGVNTPGNRKRRFTMSSVNGGRNIINEGGYITTYGYESGSRKKTRRMTRGITNEQQEFANFSGPGTGLFATSTNANTNVAANINNSIPLNDKPINYNGTNINELLANKDRMIFQLQNTMYSMFQDMRETSLKIREISENEARLHGQDQRHAAELRMLEVSHREQIQTYEDRIHDLQKANSRIRRKHQKEINKLLKFIPSTLKDKALEKIKYNGNYNNYNYSLQHHPHRSNSYGQLHPVLESSNRTQLPVATSYSGTNRNAHGRLMSPPPFNAIEHREDVRMNISNLSLSASSSEDEIPHTILRTSIQKPTRSLNAALNEEEAMAEMEDENTKSALPSLSPKESAANLLGNPSPKGHNSSNIKKKELTNVSALHNNNNNHNNLAAPSILPVNSTMANNNGPQPVQQQSYPKSVKLLSRDTIINDQERFSRGNNAEECTSNSSSSTNSSESIK